MTDIAARVAWRDDWIAQLGRARIGPLIGLPASGVYRVLCRHRLTGWPGWTGPRDA